MGTDAQKAFYAPLPAVWIDLTQENINLKSLSVIERDFYFKYDRKYINSGIFF
ncbi:protein of unknown function [Chryseobacterium sp. JV274]|nr:protein of unknown function [Chryseobacterium sp. JV274]